MNKLKQEKKERFTSCNILWHWNSSFRRYETHSLLLANKKWRQINNEASRIFLINNQICKSWFKNNKWKNKILDFVSSESLTIIPSHIIVIWCTNNKHCNKLFDSEHNALQFYHYINTTKNKTKEVHSKILSVDYEIKYSLCTDKHSKKNIINEWVHLVTNKNKMFYASFSHRDSDQSNPLFDALNICNGNLEFDVHCINSQLLIGHDRKHCKKNITLQSLYLNPLRKLIQQNKLKQAIYLFVDFKSDAKKSYLILHELIKNEYGNIVTSWKYNKDTNKIIKKEGYINIVITGKRDIESILCTPNLNVLERYVCIDGRIGDIEKSDIDCEYMPMISDKFNKVFPNCCYRNGYILNENDKRRLMGYIEKCRATKQRLRFWGTVDSTKLWQQLIDLDVEKDVIVINTDNQQLLIPFLIKNGY